MTATEDIVSAGSMLPALVAARFDVTDPAAPAVTCGGSTMSYAELDATAWAVTGELARRGRGRGDVVPVIAARGGGLVAAWLGVLRAGAAYAPLGTDTPAQRLGHILEELGASVVVVDGAGEALLGRLGSSVDLVRVHEVAPSGPVGGLVAPRADDPAVVIYTSGTTGRPKGVLGSHRGLLNTALWWADDGELTPADRLLCTWSTAFDGATHEVFRSLVAGSELVFADDVERRDPVALGRMIRGSRGATVTSMTPSLLRAVLDAAVGERTTLRLLYVGGEALSRPLAEQCDRQWQVPIRNIYGPTEAACISTYATVDLADERPPPIGTPLPNTRAYVLGRHQEELPPGVPGELYVAGASVALGYLGQPERTREAFLPDPYGAAPDARMYRTGDRVVLRPDGALEHLGRVDEQVKILGHRVEPSEVRRLLEEQPAVHAAAVTAVGDPLRLVAYVELTPEATAGGLPSRDDVLRPLLDWIPPAVLPARLLVVDALPLTSNDKVDLAALLASDFPELPDAPRRSAELTEHQLPAADLFLTALAGTGRATVGGVEDLAPDANFFTLGGHSLLAVRMLGDCERRGLGQVALRDFLADPTVAGLAELLGGAGAQVPDVVDDGTVDWPATSPQQRFWFIDHVAELRTAYAVPTVLELTGDVDVPRLLRSTRAVLGRHPALRSRFRLDRKRRAVVYRIDGPPPEVALFDVADWPAARIDAQLADLCWQPFDLASGPLARAAVLHAADRTLLVLAVHHIVTDGISQDLVVDQIAALYRAAGSGAQARLADPVHPARLAATGRPEAGPDRVAEVVARLRGAPTDVALPHDRERPEVQPVLGETCTTVLARACTSRLRATADELGCTTFMLAASLLGATLAELSEQRDFLFAFPWTARELPLAADAVGLYVNTLVVRVDLRDHPTWETLLTRTRDECLAAYRGADVAFDAVASVLHPDRDLSRPALTPVYLAARHGPALPARFGPGATGRHLPPRPLYVKYELEVTVTDEEEGDGGGLAVAASYAVDLFEPETIGRVLRVLADKAAELANDPTAQVLRRLP